MEDVPTVEFILKGSYSTASTAMQIGGGLWWEQSSERGGIKSQAAQFIGDPIDDLLELTVVDGGCDPVLREAISEQGGLELVAELHVEESPTSRETISSRLGYGKVASSCNKSSGWIR